MEGGWDTHLSVSVVEVGVVASVSLLVGRLHVTGQQVEEAKHNTQGNVTTSLTSVYQCTSD